MGGDGVLPLRPLTVGELLDTAMALLRRHAATLLITGLVLAGLEQALLYPLRQFALPQPPSYLHIDFSRFGSYWLLISVGLGTESVIITLLGALAGKAAVDSLTGESGRRLYRGARLGPAAVLGVVIGVVAALSALFGFVPWLAWYAFVGLSAPALVIDRRIPLRRLVPNVTFTSVPMPDLTAPPRPIGPFAALGRSMVLVSRGRLRPGVVRLLGYLAWYLIRLALGAGGVAALGLVLNTGSGAWTWVVTLAAWIVVNAVAYPALACLDAALHLENRMRVEGLDIALARAVANRAPLASVLAVPR